MDQLPFVSEEAAVLKQSDCSNLVSEAPERYEGLSMGTLIVWEKKGSSVSARQV